MPNKRSAQKTLLALWLEKSEVQRLSDFAKDLGLNRSALLRRVIDDQLRLSAEVAENKGLVSCCDRTETRPEDGRSTLDDCEKLEYAIIPDRDLALLRELAEGLDERVYVKNKAHRFVYANPATVKAAGCHSLWQLLAKTDEDLFDSFHAMAAKTDEARLFASKPGETLTIKKREMEMWKRDQLLVCVETTKSAWRNERGNVIGVLGVTRQLRLDEIEAWSEN